MIAVDTNIVVRLLTGDDAKQCAAAKTLFAGGAIWIARTVLLETVWVLQSVYAFDEEAIGIGLAKLLGLKNVHVDNKASLAASLALTSKGVELADAIHLSSRPDGATFVSFDQAFVKRAKRAGVADIFSA
jgi:predicted nucleic-acid-binding protein